MKKNRRKKTCVEFAMASELYDKDIQLNMINLQKLRRKG